MTRPILGFLADFTPVGRPADVEAPPALDMDHGGSAPLDALVALARAEGIAEGRQIAEAEAALERRASAEAGIAALAAARAHWAAEEGSALAEGFRAALAALEAALADSLAAALTPLVAPALRRRALDELQGALADLMAGQSGVLVTVRGPEDLLAVLREKAGDSPAVTFAAAAGADITVQTGDTTIRSQLGAWTQRFHTLLEVTP